MSYVYMDQKVIKNLEDLVDSNKRKEVILDKINKNLYYQNKLKMIELKIRCCRLSDLTATKHINEMDEIDKNLQKTI